MRWQLPLPFVLAVMLAAIAVLLVQLPVRAQEPGDDRAEPSYAPPAGPDTAEGQYLVRVPGATVAERSAAGEGLARAAGLRVDRAFSIIDWVLLVEDPGVPARPYQAVADVLSLLPDALLVEPVYLRYTTEATPVEGPAPTQPGAVSVTDPRIWEQWGHFNTNATDAWETTFGSGVVVAIVDSGVDYTHLDLDENIIVQVGDAIDGIDNDGDGCIDDFRGCDLVDGDNDPTDEYGHGTHVAGTVAAERNNGIFGTGIAPDATILPVRVCNASGSCPAVIAGIDYAVANGANVINMSLGGPSFSQAEQDAVTAAWNAGIVVIASAGNTGTNVVQYPAGYTNVMGVAALTPANVQASFSTSGAHVDIAAPGSSVLSTVPAGGCTLCETGKWAYLNGTSMAAPHVAGVAALLFASGVTDKAAVVTALQGSAIDLGVAGRDDLYGHGGVNACAALAGCTSPPTGDYFEVAIDHTWVGDLVVALDSPGAIGSVTLFDRNESGFGSSQNDILVRYQLPAGTPTGTWTLRAQDWATSNGNNPESKGVGDILAFSVSSGGVVTASSETPLTIPDANRQGGGIVAGAEVSVGLTVPSGLSIAISTGAVDFGVVALGGTPSTDTDGGTQTVTNNSGVPIDLTVDYEAAGADCDANPGNGLEWTAVDPSNAGTDTFAMRVMLNASTFVDLPASGGASLSGPIAASGGTGSLDIQLEMPTSVTTPGPCTVTIIVTAVEAP